MSDTSEESENFIATIVDASYDYIELSNGKVISWKFDTFRKCCEEVGEYRSSKSINPEDMIDALFIKYDVVDRGSSKCALIIYTSSGRYIQKFFNRHNGYYSHSFTVYEDDECVIEKCL